MTIYSAEAQPLLEELANLMQSQRKLMNDASELLRAGDAATAADALEKFNNKRDEIMAQLQRYMIGN